jgi:hypothetical protein
MSEPHEVAIHTVDYLNATGGATEEDGPVVVLTVRPDAGSWRPHNIALTVRKAQRLQADLNRLFRESPSLVAWLKQHQQAPEIPPISTPE